jgi:hypothetical protein
MNDRPPSSSIASADEIDARELRADGLGRGSNLLYDGWNQQDFLLHDRVEEGSSPEAVLEHGKQRFGRAVVGGFSVWGRPAAAILRGSPVVVKIGSTTLGDAP